MAARACHRVRAATRLRRARSRSRTARRVHHARRARARRRRYRNALARPLSRGRRRPDARSARSLRRSRANRFRSARRPGALHRRRRQRQAPIRPRSRSCGPRCRRGSCWWTRSRGSGLVLGRGRSPRDASTPTRRIAAVAVLLGVLVALSFGTGDFFGGRASGRASVLGTLVISQTCAFVGAVVLVSVDRGHRRVARHRARCARGPRERAGTRPPLRRARAIRHRGGRTDHRSRRLARAGHLGTAAR